VPWRLLVDPARHTFHKLCIGDPALGSNDLKYESFRWGLCLWPLFCSWCGAWAAWAANATPWPVRPAGLGWGLGVQPALACVQLSSGPAPAAVGCSCSHDPDHLMEPCCRRQFCCALRSAALACSSGQSTSGSAGAAAGGACSCSGRQPLQRQQRQPDDPLPPRPLSPQLHHPEARPPQDCAAQGEGLKRPGLRGGGRWLVDTCWRVAARPTRALGSPGEAWAGSLTFAELTVPQGLWSWSIRTSVPHSCLASCSCSSFLARVARPTRQQMLRLCCRADGKPGATQHADGHRGLGVPSEGRGTKWAGRALAALPPALHPWLPSPLPARRGRCLDPHLLPSWASVVRWSTQRGRCGVPWRPMPGARRPCAGPPSGRVQRAARSRPALVMPSCPAGCAGAGAGAAREGDLPTRPHGAPPAARPCRRSRTCASTRSACQSRSRLSFTTPSIIQTGRPPLFNQAARNQFQMSLLFMHMANLGYGVRRPAPAHHAACLAAALALAHAAVDGGGGGIGRCRAP
jgi:hypothetical protein